MHDLLLYKKMVVLRNTLNDYGVLQLVIKLHAFLLDQARCLVMKSEQLSVQGSQSKGIQSFVQTTGGLHWKLKNYQRQRKESKTLPRGYVKQVLTATEGGRFHRQAVQLGLDQQSPEKEKKNTKPGITPRAIRQAVNYRMILDKLNVLDFRAKSAATIVKNLKQEVLHSIILFSFSSVYFLRYQVNFQ